MEYVCCLCEFLSPSEVELESHIYQEHFDIFQTMDSVNMVWFSNFTFIFLLNLWLIDNGYCEHYLQITPPLFSGETNGETQNYASLQTEQPEKVKNDQNRNVQNTSSTVCRMQWTLFHWVEIGLEKFNTLLNVRSIDQQSRLTKFKLNITFYFSLLLLTCNFWPSCIFFCFSDFRLRVLPKSLRSKNLPDKAHWKQAQTHTSVWETNNDCGGWHFGH